MNCRVPSRSVLAITPRGWPQSLNLLVVSLVLCACARSQELIPGALSAPSDPKILSPVQFTQFLQVRASGDGLRASALAAGQGPASKAQSVPFDTPHRITLEEARRQAASAENPMAKLGQLQVEAAKQHRLGAQADYFPKLSSTLTNFHFNKFMGEEIQVKTLVSGGTTTVGLPLAGKDQTFIAVTAGQPLTPLFKIREVVRLAQADENIARAKAGMPVAETAENVEKNYYGLLVAQRQLAIAKANVHNGPAKQMLASNGEIPGELAAHTTDEMEVERALLMAENNVKEAMASLNLLLGYPVETELEPVPPAMQFVDLSLKEVSDKAMTSNPEVVEAEQTVIKAKAGSRLSKLDYIPDFALLGGYAYNANALPLLPRDFSFIGIMGSWNVFDFGKREHTVKERSAQLSAAELALQLTKAKVSAAVKSSYFELDRSRQLSELAHRMALTLGIERTSSSPENAELALTKAKLEIEMFQADLDYRQALARVRTLMGER